MSNVLKKTLLVLGVIILISAVALPLISKVKATNEDLDLNSLIDDGDDNNTANIFTIKFSLLRLASISWLSNSANAL